MGGGAAGFDVGPDGVAGGAEGEGREGCACTAGGEKWGGKGVRKEKGVEKAEKGEKAVGEWVGGWHLTGSPRGVALRRGSRDIYAVGVG